MFLTKERLRKSFTTLEVSYGCEDLPRAWTTDPVGNLLDKQMRGHYGDHKSKYFSVASHLSLVNQRRVC